MTNGVTWTDNHCHLDDEGLADDVVELARVAGVTRLITVGVDAQRSQACIDLAARHEGVWATVGLHPHDAIQGVESILGLLDTPGIVAIGECGLDHHYDHSPRPVQRTAFAQQVQLANERDLALVIHTREAWDETFDVLAGEGVPNRTIFHCFSGGPAEARRCLDLGAFLSFSGIVTFPKAEDLRRAATLCPADRLLVETDSPYLTPVPHRGRRNQPAFVPLVGAALAKARSVDVDVIAHDTNLNAAIAFRLPPP